MTFTKILCPTDFSTGSEQALRIAVRLANEADAELVVAHAWYLPPQMYAGQYYVPAPVMEQLTREAEAGLELALRDAKTAGAKKASGKVIDGVPWSEIVGLLERDRFDLCVMSTHGRTGVARVLLGSVAEKVIRHAPCSVLAVRPGSEPKPYTHVLVPTDFSPSARHAIDIAADLATPGGAGISLLHVLEVPVSLSGPLRVTDFARDLDKRAADALANAAAIARQNAKVPVTTASRVGYPGSEILRALDDDSTIDLVVMGSHGRTGLTRALLGSVAEKVVRHARCPVLVARLSGDSRSNG